MGRIGRIGLISLCCAGAGAAPRPNIVLILADDLGYGDVGCYGATAVSTPGIDRLAAEGLRFTDVHTPASTCTPTRYGLLTGEYAWRRSGTGILSGLAALIVPTRTVTLPSALRRAGYATAGVGKWHLGLGSGSTDYNASLTPGPLEVGFDSYFGLPATGDRTPCVYFENHGVAGYQPADPLQVSYSAKVGDEPTGEERPDLLKVQPANTAHAGTIINGISRIGWMDGGARAWWVDENMAEVLTARATNFIAAHAAGPFFLYFATHDIHTPRAPHARFAGTSAHGVRGDVIQQLDACVGALLDALDRHGIASNTLVLFTSDNGGVLQDGYLDGSDANPGNHAFNGALRGTKYQLYEGGNRVPFLARWPGRIAAGGTSPALFALTDLLATLAAVAGQPIPTDAGRDSFNVLPALLGDTMVSPRTNLVMQNNNATPLAVRQGSWKYLPSAGQLYNLASDLSETSNVAAANPARVAELTNLLAQIQSVGRLSQLRAWWPLDDGAGSAARDLSRNGADGACANEPAWADGGGFGCLRLDGAGQHVAVARLAAVTGSFTVAGWVRAAGPAWNADAAIVSRRPQLALVTAAGSRRIAVLVGQATGMVRAAEFDAGGLPGFALTNWHHYAAAFDAATRETRLYVDGTLRAAGNVPAGALPAGTGDLTLGSDGGVAGTFLAADLADLRLYAEALPPNRLANAAGAVLPDSDGDGMLDDWEYRAGLDAFDPADAAEDPDGDGATNLAEFQRNTSPTQSDLPDAGLVGWWRFDETNGAMAADSSGAGSHGALSNAPAWTPGPGRRFLRFNGSNQFVQVGSLSNLTNGVTAACWARSRTPAWNFAGTLLSRRPQFVLHPWLNSTRFSFIVFTPGSNQVNAELDLSTLPGFSLTNWHHYAGTYDAALGRIAVYVDGRLRAVTNITPTALQSDTGPLQIGKDDTFARYLNGDIDEARVCDRPLSDAAIASLAAGFDDDADGLPDEFERAILDASTHDAFQALEDVRPEDDFDGDRASNRDEWMAGTDPTRAADAPALDGVRWEPASGAVLVDLAGKAGRRYELDVSAAPGAEGWAAAQTSGPLAAAGRVIFTNAPAAGPAAAHRVRILWAPP